MAKLDKRFVHCKTLDLFNKLLNNGGFADESIVFVPEVNMIYTHGNKYYNLTKEEIDKLASSAPLDNPKFTGIPTAPTANSGTNTTQIATTEFVNTAVSVLEPIFLKATYTNSSDIFYLTITSGNLEEALNYANNNIRIIYVDGFGYFLLSLISETLIGSIYLYGTLFYILIDLELAKIEHDNLYIFKDDGIPISDLSVSLQNKINDPYAWCELD